MSFCVRLLVSIPLFCMVAACAGPGTKIDIAPTALAQVKTIAVIRSPEPKTYRIYYDNWRTSTALDFLFLPFVVPDLRTKADLVSKALKAHGTAVMSDLANNLSAQLIQFGFAAGVEDGQWEEADGKFTLPANKIQSEADAVLVVLAKFVGFVAHDFSDYHPTIQAEVTLLAKDRTATLYRDFHWSGAGPTSYPWKRSSANVTFANFDAIMADIQVSARSLSDAASGIATTIAADLKR